jgi:hypothetical protein
MKQERRVEGRVRQKGYRRRLFEFCRRGTCISRFGRGGGGWGGGKEGRTICGAGVAKWPRSNPCCIHVQSYHCCGVGQNISYTTKRVNTERASAGGGGLPASLLSNPTQMFDDWREWVEPRGRARNSGTQVVTRVGHISQSRNSNSQDTAEAGGVAVTSGGGG